MIKAMDNEPTLLLRVIASIVLNPDAKQKPPKIDDGGLKPGCVAIACGHRQQNEL